jgi:hypothetical protein
MITNYVFEITLGAKSIIASVSSGNEIQNTRVGPEDGYDENGVPYAHHKWIGYYKDRNFEEALKWNKIACKIRSDDLRSGHPDTIAEKRCRALILARLGQYDEAISDIGQTLNECEKEEGLLRDTLTRKVLLETIDKASTVHKLAGSYVVADSLSEKACRGYEELKKSGLTHPATLSAMFRRAMLLEFRENFASAKE